MLHSEVRRVDPSRAGTVRTEEKTYKEDRVEKEARPLLVSRQRSGMEVEESHGDHEWDHVKRWPLSWSQPSHSGSCLLAR